MAHTGDDWAGRVGHSWATEWQRTDRSFAELTARLISTAVAQFPVGSDRQQRVLDIGCGAGETTLALADARHDLDVTGLDLSAELVAVAQTRLDGRVNCRFVQGDARQWLGDGPFDAALSRHGVMFFADPVAAFTHLRTQMAHGAPLIFSCFRDRAENTWAIEASRMLGELPPTDPHAPGPFAFADRDRVTSILTSAGWDDVTATPVDFRYVAGAGDDPVQDALSFFSRIGAAAPLIVALPDDDRAAFKARFADILAHHVEDGRVGFSAAAWLWQARA